MYKSLEDLRKAHELTQEHLAKELEMCVATYSKLEKGKTRLKIIWIHKLTQVFNVSSEYIVQLFEAQTMQSCDKFTPEEIELISQYRNLSTTDRLVVCDYIQALLMKDQQKSR